MKKSLIITAVMMACWCQPMSMSAGSSSSITGASSSAGMLRGTEPGTLPAGFAPVQVRGCVYMV
jgi:hypothetical protein